jgi:hypothetical protein
LKIYKKSDETFENFGKLGANIQKFCTSSPQRPQENAEIFKATEATESTEENGHESPLTACEDKKTQKIHHEWTRIYTKFFKPQRPPS